jgi:hypothetical protein
VRRATSWLAGGSFGDDAAADQTPMDAIASQTRVRRGARRLGYGVLAAALLAAVVVLVVTSDATWWQALACGLGPDAALVLGVARGLARGQLHPRAVPLYNALHRVWGPLLLLVVAFGASLPRGYAVGALAWAFHVALDRAVGYRLRSADGFQRAEGSDESMLRDWHVLVRAASGRGR